MASLFSFVTIRNPRVPNRRELETGFVRYAADLGAGLLSAVADAIAHGGGFAAVQRLVADFRVSDRYLDTPAEVRERFGDLADFSDWLAARSGTVTWAEIRGRLESEPLDIEPFRARC